MTASLDLSPEHRGILRDLLRELLPTSAEIWVFGSRANGRSRRYSDLDLAIDAGRLLSIDETAILREAFEESDLPFTVDLVDWHAIGENFRQIISQTCVPLV